MDLLRTQVNDFDMDFIANSNCEPVMDFLTVAVVACSRGEYWRSSPRIHHEIHGRVPRPEKTMGSTVPSERVHLPEQSSCRAKPISPACVYRAPQTRCWTHVAIRTELY